MMRMWVLLEHVDGGTWIDTQIQAPAESWGKACMAVLADEFTAQGIDALLLDVAGRPWMPIVTDHGTYKVVPAATAEVAPSGGA